MKFIISAALAGGGYDHGEADKECKNVGEGKKRRQRANCQHYKMKPNAAHDIKFGKEVEEQNKCDIFLGCEIDLDHFGGCRKKKGVRWRDKEFVCFFDPPSLPFYAV